MIDNEKVQNRGHTVPHKVMPTQIVGRAIFFLAR
jgi:hypothetical protein